MSAICCLPAGPASIAAPPGPASPPARVNLQSPPAAPAAAATASTAASTDPASRIAAPGAQPDDEAVLKAIEKARIFLWSKQQKDGKWNNLNIAQTVWPVGSTALACYAMIESGVSPQDPKLEKALEWLQTQKTTKTYELSIRAGIWTDINRSTQNKYSKPLQDDIEALLIREGGGYSYDVLDAAARPDNSNSHFALLGVWAGALGRQEVPNVYWRSAMYYWQARQKPDGGWNYDNSDKETTATMTAGGITSLLICMDKLCAGAEGTYDRIKTMKPINSGMAWLEKNLPAIMAGKCDYYFLYCLERAGATSGYKHFGSMDWYKAGAAQLLASQREDGSWKMDDPRRGNDEIATAMAVLFLSRGRNPIVFSKLQYGEDWSNRPRDIAILTRWISQTYERNINWQIVNVKLPLDEWCDSPILFISGSRPPKFSDEEIARLRQFVERGGVIFSCASYDGAGFRQGIRETYAKLFPAYKLFRCPANHEIFSMREKGATMPIDFSIITNGVRPLVVHTDSDLSRSWQFGLISDDQERYAFEAAGNLFLYVTDKGSLKQHQMLVWPVEQPPASRPAVRLVRLKHNGNWDPEPLAFQRFARLMAARYNVGIDMAEPVEIESLNKANAKIAVMTGTEAIKLSPEQLAAIKQFVAAGGTFFIDAAGGSQDFAQSMKKTIQDAFGGENMIFIPLDSKIYRMPGLIIDKVAYRRRPAIKLGLRSEPRLQTVLVKGRPAIIFSEEDIISGLVGYPSFTCDGYSPDSAFDLMRNIVFFAGELPLPEKNNGVNGKNGVNGSSTSMPATSPSSAPATRPASSSPVGPATVLPATPSG
ncbi:MAG: DUF4159 domain-containing protein [Planctomycetes bacterium]|nr:DUF4159 domain-containing protein [Planctomycetota bacterium]